MLRFVCHEFAHFWARGGRFNTVDNWINESYAEYLGTMAVRTYLGQDAFEAMVEGYRKQIAGEDLPHIWKPGDTERLPYLVNYRKGTLALHRLEQRLGEEQFLAFTQELFRSREKSTPMMLDTLESMAGTESRAFFEAVLAE